MIETRLHLHIKEKEKHVTMTYKYSIYNSRYADYATNVEKYYTYGNLSALLDHTPKRRVQC